MTAEWNLATCVRDDADQELAQRVLQVLIAKRRALGCLSVSAECGTVTLSGAVSSYYAKQLALHVAQRVREVVQVHDEMSVKPIAR